MEGFLDLLSNPEASAVSLLLGKDEEQKNNHSIGSTVAHVC
jgi:hypothetical protein